VRPAYTNYVKEPFRTIARDEVQKYKGLDIKDNIDPIGAAITKRLNTYLANTPFRVIQAVVGNIQYPKSVEEESPRSWRRLNCWNRKRPKS
jgi:hypothetical protein